jgi:hypothetical protein
MKTYQDLIVILKKESQKLIEIAKVFGFVNLSLYFEDNDKGIVLISDESKDIKDPIGNELYYLVIFECIIGCNVSFYPRESLEKFFVENCKKYEIEINNFEKLEANIKKYKDLTFDEIDEIQSEIFQDRRELSFTTAIETLNKLIGKELYQCSYKTQIICSITKEDDNK